MKLRTKYVLGGISMSIGCLIWYKWPELQFIGSLLVVGLVLITTQRAEWTKPVRLGVPKWNARGFFSRMSILLCSALLVILVGRLPHGMIEELLGTWYFTGALWMLLLSMLITRFIEEEEKAQQSHAEATASGAPDAAPEASDA